MQNTIETTALRKVYPPPASRKRAPGDAGRKGGAGTVALESLDLTVAGGEFFGMLGPNGAGKTTTIGVLTTRVVPTAGRAVVAGADVVSASADVRQRIGVVPQRPNPDRSLTVLENLVFHATYFGIAMADARRRAEELLEQFSIADKKDAKVDQLSGGQQQRLMIARALSHDPRVIFLDEPTVGLDPQARLALWGILRDLHQQGRTIVMTTHYMEEADQLCDRIAILDRGKLLALDTPSRLKAQAPGDTVIDVTFDGDTSPLVAQANAIDGVSRAEAHGARLRVFSSKAGEVIPALISAGDAAGRSVRDIHLSRPSLETLFISLTGRNLA